MASLLSQATAGTPKVSPFSATAAKVSPTSPAVPSYGRSVAPQASTTPSMGTKAISPTTTVTKPPTTLPKAQASPVPTSAGSYKGVSITPGDDASVAAQIAKINANQPATQNTPQTPTYPGLMGAQIQAKDQAAAAPVTPPAPPTYSGLIGSAANQAGNINTQAGNINNTAAQIGANGQMSPQELAKIQLLGGLTDSQAADSANIETHPGVGGFAMGRDAINFQNHEAMRSSLGQQIQGYAASRQANTAALTGQANAQNQAGGLMNQAGGLYQNAANSAQPQLGSIGQVPFNPLNQDQGSVLGSTQPGGLTAAGNLLGQFQGAQAAGAAPGQAQAGVVNTQTQQAAGYQSALQQGQNLQAQLSDLVTTFGLNPSDINGVNAGIQKIAQNVSSPQYKILQNYVNDIANTYAQVLTPPGGSATDTSRGIASSMIDATASGQSLLKVMQSLDAAAKAKIAGVSTTGTNTPTGGNQSATGVIQTKAGAVNTNW